MFEVLRSHRGQILALALAAGLALLLLLGAFNGSPAAATTRTGHDFTYYNNANHTTVVGYRYYCIGYQGGWGSITPYYVINTYPCR
jgi:hypothetical protein